jgi:DNA repair exonuclease SbcCD nuclease subunit
MKILRIGDMHVRPSNLAEAHDLMEFVLQTAKDNMVNRIEILGDLMHNNAIIRLEVLDFWEHWLDKISYIFQTFVLVGNHDFLSHKESILNSLSIFKRIDNGMGNLTIVTNPVQIGMFLYLPYVHDNQEFIDSVKKFSDVKVLVCHQEFDGSQYDNGFYAPNGVKPEDIPVDIIISGHIHKQQIIANGKIDYPGSPMWNSAVDANEKKGIFIYEHDDNTGVILSRTMIPTNEIVMSIISLTWQEGEEAPEIPGHADVVVELIGSSDWIAKQKPLLKDIARIKSKITDKKKPQNRKTGNGLEDYLLNIYNTKMNKKELFDYAKELGIV